MADPYVDRKFARASYRPKNLMSPGLQRAREPFRLRNALTGLALAGFVAGVWAYSISAVKQDDFGDVDEEARALIADMRKSESTVVAVDASKTAANTEMPPPNLASIPPSPESASASVEQTHRRGILPPLLERRIPGLFDPSSGTLVWGAPSVDNVGKLRIGSEGSRRVF